MMKRTYKLSIILTLALLVPYASVAQLTTGTPPFGSFGGGPDTIDLANLNVHLSIPVIHKAGRGLPFNYDITYDSAVWYPVGASGNQTWQHVSNWGWIAQTAGVTGVLTKSIGSSGPCTIAGRTTGTWYVYVNYVYYDPWGVPHRYFSNYRWWTGVGTGCSGGWSVNEAAGDGSGYTLNLPVPYTAGVNGMSNTRGTVLNPATSSTDRNGNFITVGTNGVFTDTLNTAALTVAGSGTPASPVTFTYSAPGPSGSGTNATVTLNYTQFTVATNFGISGIHEVGATSTPLVTSAVLPDQSQYTFTYEATPSIPSLGACTPLSGTYQQNCVTARLASVTLPSGGTISYSYSGGSNGILNDGTTATLTRVVTPGGTWAYAHSLGTAPASTTIITDPERDSLAPNGNQTVIQFQGIYETQRQTYQGLSSGGAILQTINTCYNGAASPCTGTAVGLPISRRTQLVAYPDNTGKVCEHDQYFNSYGLQTEQDDYDYGNGAPATTPLRKEITVYNTALTNGIVGMPSSATICNGSGTSTSCTGPSGSSTGTVVAQTTYAYDETAVVAPTGTTPQHNSVSGSRGNATTTKQLAQGSTYLTSTTSYFDTGNPQITTDVNNAQLTFNYPDATSTCGNAFPTSVSAPLSLSESMTWNCVGGLQLTAIDENGKTTTTAYTDSFFWRPSSVTDPSGAVTNFSYATSSPYNWSESTMTVSSGSAVVDVLNTLDGLGRSHLQQARQGPGSPNFDTVETDYDSLGRVSRVTLPYTGTSGQTNSSAPATITTYDSVSRPLTVTDAGSGSVSYTYTKNDAYISMGPAPTGENAKRRQLEYNSIGQLTSVCEVTSSSQSGACGQTNPANGYLTSYTHDVLGNLTGVSQNAQPNGTVQTRSYSFDGLSRMTSEVNPESGTTAYTYDTVSSGNCAGTFNGDLIKRVDAVGNTACFTYDPFHRNLAVTYPSGAYASATPSKYFVYDTATVNGTTMANAKGRLAEAYTCTTCPGTKITDIGLSYTTRGETSDIYESAPHSSGYYRVTQTYWPHGAPSQLSNLAGLPNISFGGTIGSTVGLDGEGRITQVTASSGQNPVTGVTYNNGSLPTQVNFGSGDTDIFAYDPNTLRMAQFKFNVGTQSQYFNGVLTWNANSTLNQLAITDQFNSSDTQTCNYSHDDLRRIVSANCGTAANQSFTYDPFGNISKSGSPYTFQPTYSAATNRFSTIPGCGALSYDNNGNVLNDCNHNYTWDADGNSVGIDTVGLTFDAFDRMVEQARGTNYTEIVYTPTGGKLALMNGQTLQKGFVSLPGKATAVYIGSGLDHYRHADWLGSARLTSSPSRTYLSSVAYAPFGETYASSGTTDPSFTGQNPDTVSSDYDFLYRPYSVQGRWPTPDPAAISSVDPATPQSWNRYAYVLNSPLSFTDPLGLVCFWDDGTADDTAANGGATQQQCEEQGGTWYEEHDSITVTADPIDTGGIGQWLSDWWDSFNSIDVTQLSIQLNQCAARNADELYSKVLGKNKVANAALGNSFAALSQLALGPDNGKGARDLAADAAVHGGTKLMLQQGVGRIATRMGTAIYAVPGTEMQLGGQQRFATVVERYVAQRVRDLPAFAKVMEGAESFLDGKVLLDGLTYLSMELSCTL